MCGGEGYTSAEKLEGGGQMPLTRRVLVMGKIYYVTADCTGRLSICLKVKVLMSLKVLGFRVYHQTLNGIFHQRMSHADARRLMYQQHHGVPGLVGSIDCMYDGWRLSLVAWQGQFEGTKNAPH